MLRGLFLVPVLAASMLLTGCGGQAPGDQDASDWPQADPLDLPGLDGLDTNEALSKVARSVALMAANYARSEGRSEVTTFDIDRSSPNFAQSYAVNGIEINASGSGVEIRTDGLLDHHGQAIGDGHTDHDHNTGSGTGGDQDHAAADAGPGLVFVCPGPAAEPAALVSSTPCPE